MSRLLRFLHEEDAATAVEYAVMLAMILLACVGAIALIGQQTHTLWNDNETGLRSAFSPNP